MMIIFLLLTVVCARIDWWPLIGDLLKVWGKGGVKVWSMILYCSEFYNQWFYRKRFSGLLFRNNVIMPLQNYYPIKLNRFHNLKIKTFLFFSTAFQKEEYWIKTYKISILRWIYLSLTWNKILLLFDVE